MKKTIFLFFILFASLRFLTAQPAAVIFRSSDTAMQNAFGLAKQMALHYKAGPGDPVGPWYESALPPRFAFCMRDVSHQCIGAEILEMHAENKNMFSKFIRNISASKDWCSYWEMDKFNRPSPADYKNDREFWYNLNANFDLLDACWRSYLWTGDTMFLNNPAFQYFYAKSVDEFIVKWILQPDSLLTRPAYPNAPEPFDSNNSFHRCRGLPSYSESVHDLKMGIDLVAAIYRGMLSYASFLKAGNKADKADAIIKKAGLYRQHIDNFWWDPQASLYNTHYTNSHQFGKGEGETFLLWFDALVDTAREKKTIEHLLSMDLNVENQSYLPLQLYRHGYWQKAREMVLHLTDPATERREYPEVSYGMVEAFVQGLMGIDANALSRTVSSIYRSGAGSGSLVDLPVLNTTIDISHLSRTSSAITNKGKYPFIWKAMFYGNHGMAIINKRKVQLKKEKDSRGVLVSFINTRIAPGQHTTITAL